MLLPAGVIAAYSQLGTVFTSGKLSEEAWIHRSTAKYYINKIVVLRIFSKIPHRRKYQKYANARTFSDWLKDMVRLAIHPLERGVEIVPVKRKSRGRSKGSKGRSSMVQCCICGEIVPRDKAKKVSRRVSLVDSRLFKELRQRGAHISSRQETRYYCVSCAVHRGVVKVRARDKRKHRRRKR